MTTIRVTESICPECLNVLPATLFVEDDKVYMKKTCPDHGEFKDLVWGDYSEYKRVMRARVHYAVPDGRLIPFCTMNTLHRKEIEKQFAKPIEISQITPLADIKAILGDM